jgi:hypothetical protein
MFPYACSTTERCSNLQLLATPYCPRLPYFLFTGSAPRTQPIPLTKPPVIILLTISLFLTRPSLSGDKGRSSSWVATDAEPSAAPLSGKAFLCSAKAAPRATSNRPMGASWWWEFGIAARARRAARCCSVSRRHAPNPKARIRPGRRSVCRLFYPRCLLLAVHARAARWVLRRSDARRRGFPGVGLEMGRGRVQGRGVPFSERGARFGTGGLAVGGSVLWRGSGLRCRRRARWCRQGRRWCLGEGRRLGGGKGC